MSLIVLFAGAAPPAQTVTFTSGIASSEAFGTPIVHQQVRPLGIASQEAFGTPTVTQQIILGGIPSQEAFGAVTVTLGVPTLSPVMAHRPRRIGRLHWVETYQVS